jgi:hypothetical protein
MKKPEGPEPDEIEVRAALETFWGRNYYAQLEFMDTLLLNDKEALEGKEAEFRFEFIKPDGKPMVVAWDLLEECLFIDPAPIPLPIYRPQFYADYPTSNKLKVQFSVHPFGKVVDKNYIYSTKRLDKPTGNKLRVFRHNVNKFNDEFGDKVILLRDYRQVIHWLIGMEKKDPKYSVNNLALSLNSLIEENTNNTLEYDDEILSKLLTYTILNETVESAPALRKGDSEYCFDRIHHNSCYCIVIHNYKPIALNIGLRLGPTVLGHYVGKYDKSYKYLVDASRAVFYKQALEHGYLYINDGSDMDSDGLKQLKNKFDPVKVLSLYETSYVEPEPHKTASDLPPVQSHKLIEYPITPPTA